ncbi:hypothetical protein MNBD_DELTA03-7, partial [hydrothermal vent metagenome]
GIGVKIFSRHVSSDERYQPVILKRLDTLDNVSI